MRMGVFGSGRMAKVYGELIESSPDCDLVGFVGNSKDKCRELEDRFNVSAIPNGNFGALINNQDMDAVVVATPEWVRMEPINYAMDAGLNLLIEKPLADNWADTKVLCDRLLKYNKVVRFCHVLRFSPKFTQAKRIISGGSLGSICHVACRRNSNRKNVVRLLGNSNLAYWLSPHDVDLILDLISSPVVEVYSICGEPGFSQNNQMLTLIKFADATTAYHEIHWNTPELSEIAKEFSLEVRLENGVIDIEDFNNNVTVFGNGKTATSPDTHEHFEIHGKFYGYFRYMFDNFCACVREKRRSCEDINKIRDVSRVIEMMNTSLLSNRPVQSSEIA